MYFNDVHILTYVLIGIIGAIIGFFVGWCNERLPEYKKVFTKEIITEYRSKLKPNYILILITAILYVAILYMYGIKPIFIQNLPLLGFLIIIPMLLSAFVIDYKLQIIPNRLNLTMFEIGLIFTFIYGIINFNLALNCAYGMLAGGGIFLVISLIGKMIAGKEAMGLGDVKLMGALGLFFGLTNTIVITVLAFLIGAIVSIIILIAKKNKNEYIPFGPFIVVSAIITILVPSNILINMLLTIFTLGMM